MICIRIFFFILAWCVRNSQKNNLKKLVYLLHDHISFSNQIKNIFFTKTPITSKDATKFTSDSIAIKWNDTWSQLPTTNKLRYIQLTTPKFGIPPLTPAGKEKSLSVDLRIAHALFTHSYILNKSLPPFYLTCSVPHSRIDCPKFDLTSSRLSLSPSLLNFLGDNEATLFRLFNFLQQFNLLS